MTASATEILNDLQALVERALFREAARLGLETPEVYVQRVPRKTNTLQDTIYGINGLPVCRAMIWTDDNQSKISWTVSSDPKLLKTISREGKSNV